MVDCFDALTSDRPYRPRLEDAAALQILAERAATMYDPRVVDAFFACHGMAAVDTRFRRRPFRANTPQPSSPGAGKCLAPRMVDELEAFFQLGRALSHVRDGRAVDVIWTHLRRMCPPRRWCSIPTILHATRSPLLVKRARSGQAFERGTTIQLGERLSGWVAATGQSVMNSDARLDLDEAARERSPLRSALAVPMISNGQAVGVLSAYASQPDAFSEPHRRLLQAAAVALSGVDRSSVGRSMAKARLVS